MLSSSGRVSNRLGVGKGIEAGSSGCLPRARSGGVSLSCCQVFLGGLG